MKVLTKCFTCTDQFTPIKIERSVFLSSIFLNWVFTNNRKLFAQAMLKVRGVIELLQQTTRQQNEQCA